MIRKIPLAQGETCRTACAPVALRAGVDEKTGEVLSAPVLAEGVGWAADLVSGMASALLAAHFNAADVHTLAEGVDPAGRKLPANAWMVLREVRARGWALTDEHLARGIRSVAAPPRDGQGRVFAAVNVNTHAAETSLDHLVQHHLPLLLAAAGEISADVARVGSVPQVTRDL